MCPEDKLDLSALPQTLAIIGVLTIIYLALRTFHQKFPQVGEWIVAKTPWMGWAKYDAKTDTLTPYNPRRWQ